MPNILRLECPTCKTSYTGERCGIRPLQDYENAIVTIVCKICGKSFDATITPREVTEALSWWRTIVLRQEPQRRVDGHEVVATARE